MAKEGKEKSELLARMEESVIGRIYRCKECDSAYYVIHSSIEEDGKVSVAALNLTSNQIVFVKPNSAKYDFIEIERSELEMREKKNLKRYMLER